MCVFIVGPVGSVEPFRVNMEQRELEDRGDVGSSAGVARFVLFSTERRGGGGREGGRLVGD